MILLLAWACGSSPAFPDAGDRATYRELAAARDPDPDRDIPRCAALSDPDLAGDCALAVAVHALPKHPEACGGVPEGAWRDECWFQAMEGERRRARWDEALADCDRAGRFRDECRFHLWEQDVLRLQQGLDWKAARHEPPGNVGKGAPVAPELGPEDVAEAARRGRPLFDEWNERMGPDWRADDSELPLGAVAKDRTFAAVFWTRFFAQLADKDPVPDATRCSQADDLEGYCVDGVIDVVRRRAIDRTRGRCPGLPEDDAGAVAWWTDRGVAFVAEPRVVAALKQVCR